MRVTFVTSLVHFVLLYTLCLTPFFSAQAQVSCGNIIAPSGWDVGFVDAGTPLETLAVSDCSAPFGILKDTNVPNQLKFFENVVNNNDTITLDTDSTKEYEIVYNPPTPQTYFLTALFLHENADYRYVSLDPVSPTEAEYREMASVLFADQAEIDENVVRIMQSDPWQGLEYGSAEYIEIDTFFDYVSNHYNTNPRLGPGTYTLVFKELTNSGGIGIYQKVLHYFATTFATVAYAQAIPEQNTYTITFTIEGKSLPPKGASSVLFLPGIQASRLYTQGVLGTEDQLWEPNINSDVQQLAMDSNGVSQNNVYTRDIMEAIPGATVYDLFGKSMVQLVANHTIKAWTPFAYDWRYTVDNVAQNGAQYEEGIRDAIDEIEYLASNSYTGKVTIIGHSNGGLLAKAIMLRLEQEGKTNLVDRVIFLASPQLGTPKAIATMLHGYDQEKAWGLIIDDITARGVIRNLPGAYGLIPSKKYFDTVQTPFITFDSSTSTKIFRDVYGTSIDTVQELQQFMTGSGDGRSQATTIDEAIQVNNAMFTKSTQDHQNVFDNWTAPAGVAVDEVIGVGLDTVSALQYKTFKETVCTLLVFCSVKEVYKPVPKFSQYGDATVIDASAEGYQGEKNKYFVDLKKIVDLDKAHIVEHYNISEHSSVQQLIQNILTGTSTANIQFISTTSPQFEDNRLLFGVHSPVSIEIRDTQGRIVSIDRSSGVPVLKEEIPHSSYFELGDSKYVIVPDGVQYDVIMKGAGKGGVTFSLDNLHGSIQTNAVSVRVATITASTSIQVPYNATTLGNLSVDANGDGAIDTVLTPQGVDITPKVTYTTLKDAIQKLKITNVRKVPLLLLAATAEIIDKKVLSNQKLLPVKILTLNELQNLVVTYQKKAWITKSQADTIIVIINKLK